MCKKHFKNEDLTVTTNASGKSLYKLNFNSIPLTINESESNHLNWTWLPKKPGVGSSNNKGSKNTYVWKNNNDNEANKVNDSGGVNKSLICRFVRMKIENVDMCFIDDYDLDDNEIRIFSKYCIGVIQRQSNTSNWVAFLKLGIFNNVVQYNSKSSILENVDDMVNYMLFAIGKNLFCRGLSLSDLYSKGLTKDTTNEIDFFGLYESCEGITDASRTGLCRGCLGFLNQLNKKSTKT
eukprot:Pgem_evm1s1384